MTVLQLRLIENASAIFFQRLTDKYHIYNIGDVFEYNKLMFNKLLSDEKKLFTEMQLKLGYYRVTNTYRETDEENDLIIIELLLIK